MKQITPITAFVAGLILAIAPASAQTVLSGGESWSAYDVLDFQTDSSGDQLNDGDPARDPVTGIGMFNSGSNNGIWSQTSGSGKFVADGAGFAVTDGDAGTWSRQIDYTGGISTGKWRILLDVGSYDLTTMDNMTDFGTGGSNAINELRLDLYSAGASVVNLRFRFRDNDGGTDGVADEVQVAAVAETTTNNADLFPGWNTNLTNTPGPNQQFDYVAIEFDFDTGNIFYERWDGAIVRGTGVSTGTGNQDSGTIAFSSFDSLRLRATGTGGWNSSTADTGVLTTDLIGLYTAIPESSSYALLAGLMVGAAGLVRRRR